MDLSEFLHFCKHFEIPLSSKAQLQVYKKVVDGSPTSAFTKFTFKEALKLLFHEVDKQKLAGLELLLRKRIRQINAKSTTEPGEKLSQLNDAKARLMNLKRKQPGDTFEHAIRWLGIDTMSMKEIKVHLNKTATVPIVAIPSGSPDQKTPKKSSGLRSSSVS